LFTPTIKQPGPYLVQSLPRVRY